jgi:hypothetical protein
MEPPFHFSRPLPPHTLAFKLSQIALEVIPG